MLACNGRKLRLMIGLAGGVFVLWSLGVQTRGDPQKQKEGDKAKQAEPTKLYFGTSACSDCHTKPNPNKLTICKCDEFSYWEKNDKHKDATLVLLPREGKKGEVLETLGSRICKVMNIPNVLEDKRCMSCHGVLVEDKKQLDGSFKIKDGVSCVACHGPYEEWVTAHSQPFQKGIDLWRGKTRSDKEKHFGMRDLWDPAKRAAVCASCHIGNATEGKVVTHEMYAAGHPPLPNLEVTTFSDGMPRHWEYLAEKNADRIKLVKEFYKDYDPATLERTELTVVSGLIGFRESMKLLGAQAGRGYAEGKDPGWPEFAQFDCYACHHDLKSKSWRQERGYTGKPGRPVMRQWPTALVKLAVRHAARDAQGKYDPKLAEKLNADYDEKMKALTGAFSSQPFGDPKTVAAAAGKLVAWAEELLPRLRKQPFDKTASQELLGTLETLHEQASFDFDSARQVSWAYKALLEEVHPGKSRDKGVNEQYQSLSNQLQLKLIQGQKEIAKDFLPSYLDAINQYEPKQFRHNFNALTKHVNLLPIPPKNPR